MNGFFRATVMGALLWAAPAHAEWQVWAYFGKTFTHDSDADYSIGGATTRYSVDWDGKSFEAPPYYGFRITRWFESNPDWGLQLDFNHIKTYADLGDPTVGGTFSQLEFTDGLNILTLDAVHRWQNGGAFTPFAGAGIGVNIPKVEITAPGDGIDVDEYQLGGIALTAFLGAAYAITESLSLFGEYRLSYADVDADLGGGNSLETSLLNHHLNIGLSFKFWH